MISATLRPLDELQPGLSRSRGLVGFHAEKLGKDVFDYEPI
jgi:hypothetical protein